MFHCISKCICSQSPFLMEHLTEWEVSSVELTLGNVPQLVNNRHGALYELWSNREIRCSQPHPGRSEKTAFQLQLEKRAGVCWADTQRWGQLGKGWSVRQVLWLARRQEHTHTSHRTCFTGRRITAVNEKALDLWKKMSETGMSEKYGGVKLGLVSGTWLTVNNMEFSHPLHSTGKRSST